MFPSGCWTFSGWLSLFSGASRPHSVMFELRVLAVTTALYCIWRARNVRKFKLEFMSVEECCFRAYRMLRLRWSVLQVQVNRYTRQIAHKLGCE